jgi:3-oxoacyl-[acyl-carrier protein] reductase
MGILEGKVAVVTCASHGVGAAIVGSLAEAGAAEVVNYLKSESCAEEVVRDIRKSGGDALAYCADVTDEAAGGEVVRAAADAFGAVDVLVNNALPDYRFELVARKDLEHIGWDHSLQQLGALRGALYCAQAVVPGMVENGGGRIVSVRSNLINNPVVAYHDYTTAKSAFLGCSHNLAAKLGSHNMTVNMVAGGLVGKTAASAATTKEVCNIATKSTPLRGLGTPKDLGRAVLMFAASWASFVTGQYVTCDGGLVMP